MGSYTKKTKNFEEKEVIDFLENSISDMKNITHKCRKLKDYKDIIATYYYMDSARNFDLDYPNVQQFVLKFDKISPNLLCTALERKIWKDFCNFANKNDNFTENDIISYFHSVCRLKKFNFDSIRS